jgi:F-type H+-transporting ATPase subunit a
MTGAPTVLAAGDIEVGHHRTAEILGMTVNVDTLWSTLIAGAIILITGIYMARRATSGRPSKLQLAFETIVDAIEKQVESSMGKVAPFVVPLAFTLFVFILIANWLGLIPSRGYLEAPSSDINMTLALSLFVIVWMHAAHIRKAGFGRYLRHYVGAYPALAPLNVIEEIAKPVTLTLRLWGNIFASGIMLAIIGLIPNALMWLPNAGWKLIDFFIAIIQAFIFALLTILYFGFALGEEGH